VPNSLLSSCSLCLYPFAQGSVSVLYKVLIRFRSDRNTDSAFPDNDYIGFYDPGNEIDRQHRFTSDFNFSYPIKTYLH